MAAQMTENTLICESTNFTINNHVDFDYMVAIEGDGNCGYRALSYFLFENQNLFQIVKRELLMSEKNDPTEVPGVHEDDWLDNGRIVRFVNNKFCNVVVIREMENGSNVHLCTVFKKAENNDMKYCFLYLVRTPSGAGHYEYYDVDYKGEEGLQAFVDDHTDYHDAEGSESDGDFSVISGESTQDSFWSCEDEVPVKKPGKYDSDYKHIFKSIPKNFSEMFSGQNLGVPRLTIGSVQLGKSEYILYKSLHLISWTGINVIIVTSCSLKQQFRERISKLGIETEHDFLSVIDDNKKIPSILENAKDRRCIFIVGAHNANIDALANNWFEKCSEKPFYLLIDEADLFNNPVEDKHEANKVSVSLENLKVSELCRGSDHLTATPYSYTYVKDKFPIRAEDVTVLPKYSDYVSFGHPKFIVNTIDKDLYQITDKAEMKTELKKIIKKARKEKEFRNDIRMYINITEMVADDKKMSQNIIKKLIKDIYAKWDRKCAFITANTSKYMYFDRNAGHSECEGIECNSMAEAMLKYRDENYECDDFHLNLFIISSKQTGRGHSLRTVARQNYSVKDNDITYANCALFCCSTGLTTDSIMQAALRIGGRFRDYEQVPDFKLVLYTTERVRNIIKTQREKDEEDYKFIAENPDKFVTEVIKPTATKIHKVVSKCRGTHIQRKVKKWVYQTVDTITAAKTSATVFNSTKLSEKILNILKSGPKTVCEIYESSTWGELTTSTPTNTISTMCIRMCDAKILGRRDRPFVYYV
jgi:hypothetical protein